MIRILLFAGLYAVLLSCHQNHTDESKSDNQHTDMHFAIGTYTQKEGHVDGKASGIYIAKLNETDLSIEIIDSLTGITNPSYLSIDSKNKNLYAVSENGGDPVAGIIRAYGYDDQWRFQPLNDASTQGNAPCHLTLSTDQKYILAANYMGGISAHQVNEDGSIGALTDTAYHKGYDPQSARQAASHPHMIFQTPVENTVLVCDLGSNRIFHYHIDEGKYQLIGSTESMLGAGPRHLIHHPKHRYVYSLNELNNTVEAYTYENLTQSMQRLQSIPTNDKEVPKEGMKASAIKIHPDGSYLYTANRGTGHHSISVFQINQSDGTLQKIQQIDSGGEVPRDFEITPSGEHLLVAHQNSDTIVVFTIDQESGRLASAGKSLRVPTPVCVTFF